MNPEYLWSFLLPGYLFSISIETPILLVGLSPRHSLGVRLFSGFWLTGCTYPVVVLVLPLLIDANESRGLYLWAAETFAPIAECTLFWLAFGAPLAGRGSGAAAPNESPTVSPWSMARDLATITVANLASFGLGELVHLIWPEWLANG